jgi:PAS domain S-box-containing protein
MNKSRSAMDFLVQRVRHGVMTLSASGTVMGANDHLARLLGRHAERVRGRSVFELFAESDRRTLKVMLDKRLGTASEAELDLLDQAGVPVPVLASFGPLSEGQRPCLIVDLRAEKRHTEAEARHQKAIALLAHELRNRLTPIVMAVEALREQERAAVAQHHAIDAIEAAVARSLRLLEGFTASNYN